MQEVITIDKRKDPNYSFWKNIYMAGMNGVPYENTVLSEYALKEDNGIDWDNTWMIKNTLNSVNWNRDAWLRLEEEWITLRSVKGNVINMCMTNVVDVYSLMCVMMIMC